MLETATKYILDLLTENEELKKFPKEFVNESVKWVKSWFLKPENPKTTAKLEDPNKSIEVKKDIIQDKLDDLKDNPQFTKELMERLATFEQHKARLKNVVIDSSLHAGRDIHIGDIIINPKDSLIEKDIRSLEKLLQEIGSIIIVSDYDVFKALELYNLGDHQMLTEIYEVTDQQYFRATQSILSNKYIFDENNSTLIEALFQRVDNVKKGSSEKLAYMIDGIIQYVRIIQNQIQLLRIKENPISKS